MRVPNADVDEQDRRLVRQPGVNLEGHASDPLPLVHPQDRAPVGPVHAGGEYRRARERAVADRSDVPFHAAAEPRVAHRQVGRLKDGVYGQQFAAAVIAHHADGE